MLLKIHQSAYAKHIALVLVVSILSMSFTYKKQADIVLTAGTTVPLETTSIIRSDEVSAGQIIDFKVRSDVKVNDKVVIAAGSVAKGQVVRASKAKGLGKEGFVEVELKTVTSVDGQQIVLANGNLNQAGEDKQTLSIVLGVVLCILFLTMKGENAQVPAGYQVAPTVASNTTIKV